MYINYTNGQNPLPSTGTSYDEDVAAGLDPYRTGYPVDNQGNPLWGTDYYSALGFGTIKAPVPADLRKYLFFALILIVILMVVHHGF